MFSLAGDLTNKLIALVVAVVIFMALWDWLKDTKMGKILIDIGKVLGKIAGFLWKAIKTLGGLFAKA